MQTEHKLFLVLGIIPKNRTKVSAQWRTLKTTVILVKFFLCVNWIR